MCVSLCNTNSKYYVKSEIITGQQVVVKLNTAKFHTKLFNVTQRSLYVAYSGEYMYHTAVIICTARQSQNVTQCGHYMYRRAVTICTAQRSLYEPHSCQNL